MSKKVTSVSIDEELGRRLENDDHVNASGLFNQFLKEYYATGSVDGVDLRLRRLDRELQKARDKVERLEAEREELLERKEQQEEAQSEELEEALDVLQSIPNRKLGPDNPAVVNHANDLGLSPRELAEKAKGQPAD